MMARLRRDEGGATMIEFALVSSVLFSLLIGFFVYAIIEAGDNAGADAARNGARVGILNYVNADVSGSSANTAIQKAVDTGLVGLASGTPTVTVQCLNASTLPLAVESCLSTAVTPNVDLLKVSVTWTRLVAPTSGKQTNTDSATMTIQGSGQGTTSSSCAVISSSVSPSQTTLAAAGSTGTLASAVTVTAVANDFCSSLYVSFSTGVTNVGPTVMQKASSTFTFSIAQAAYTWVAPNNYSFAFYQDGSGSQVTQPIDPVLTVSTAASCSITAASVSPSAVTLAGSSPNSLAQSVTVSVTTTTTCTGVNATFTPNTTAQTVAMTGGSGSWTLTIGATTYSWSSGGKQFTFTDGSGNPLSPPTTVLLSVAANCAVTVSISPGTFLHSNPPTVVVTAAPSTGSTCTGLTLTYDYATRGGSGNYKSNTAAMTLSGGSYSYSIPNNIQWGNGTWPMTFSITAGTSVVTSPSPVNVTVS